MNFKEIFDEEIKNKNGMYLNYTVVEQSNYFLLGLVKLIYLLPKEGNRQDENHWKGEVISSLRFLLSEFGGVKSKDELLSKFYEQLPSCLIKINKKISKDYSNLIKYITEEQLKTVADKFFPLLVDWLFNSFIDIRKCSTVNEKNIKVNNCCKEFINKITEEI